MAPTPARDSLSDIVAQHLPLGLYVVRGKSLIFHNTGFARIFGYPSGESLVNSDLYGAVYPDPKTVDLFREMHTAILHGGGEGVSWGQPSARIDGSIFWMEVEARRIEVDGQGAVLGVVHDATGCKIISEDMAASMQTLRLLFDAMEDRVYVVTQDHRVAYANRKMREAMAAGYAELPCYTACRGKDEPCKDCHPETFTSDKPVYWEYLDGRDGSWHSVTELAITMPGVDGLAKLVVARDITRRKRAEERIRRLSRGLMEAQEDERRRISRDLHDDLGQQLNAIKIGLDMLTEDLEDRPGRLKQQARDLGSLLAQSIQSVRELASGLRPSSLEQLGFIKTIRSHCEKLSSLHGMPIDLSVAGVEDQELRPEITINLFRIAQEALHNVLKHAEASSVTIRIIGSHPMLRMVIEDDGKGFKSDAEEAQGQQGFHLGLASIMERVDLLQGRCEIISRPGRGTRVVVEVPYG